MSHRIYVYYPKLDAMNASAGISSYVDSNQTEYKIVKKHKANLITSMIFEDDMSEDEFYELVEKYDNLNQFLLANAGKIQHQPVIDLDMPAQVIRSSTLGNSHLYIYKSMSYTDYSKVLTAMFKAGLVQKGFADQIGNLGFTSVRRVGILKPGVPVYADILIENAELQSLNHELTMENQYTNERMADVSIAAKQSYKEVKDKDYELQSLLSWLKTNDPALLDRYIANLSESEKIIKEAMDTLEAKGSKKAVKPWSSYAGTGTVQATLSVVAAKEHIHKIVSASLSGSLDEIIASNDGGSEF